MKIFGTKKYRLSYRLKKWWKSNFYPYNREENYQCAFGIRCKAYKRSEKCKNRFNPLVCGECWRADRLQRKKKHTEGEG